MPFGASRTAAAIAFVVSVVTSFLVGRWSGPRTGPPPADSEGLKAALGDVERTLADIRQLLASRPAAPATASPPPELRAGPSAESPVPVASPRVEVPPGPQRPAPPRGAAGPLLPPLDLSRVEEIHDWDAKEEVRRRWLLVSETDALAIFGTPGLVAEWGAGERWEYSNEDWNLSLCFLRGRLVNAYSNDKRDR
jgi:hypothetical protein